ncbi:hypothetical protein LMIY3S_03042 [Labrys miyagiensis]
MSIVLQFPKQPRPPLPPGSYDREHNAEILFFTGVRIERHTEDDHQDNRPQRRGSAGGKRHRKA